VKKENKIRLTAVLRKPIHIFVLLLVCGCLRSQGISNTPQFCIEPLLDRYLINDTIYLPLVNNSDEVLFYSVSLEEKIAGEWYKIISDIFETDNDLYNAHNVKVLVENKIVTTGFSVADLLKFRLKPTGLCRFNCVVKDSPFHKGIHYYSTVFYLDD